MNSVPHGPKEAVGKPHDKHVLHHFLAQVVVDSARPAAILLQ